MKGERLLNKDLTDTLVALNKTTNDTQNYAYDKANGGWKLVRDNGAWGVSSRLNKREMYDWMWAYIYGIQDGQKIFIKGLRNYEVLPV